MPIYSMDLRLLGPSNKNLTRLMTINASQNIRVEYIKYIYKIGELILEI